MAFPFITEGVNTAEAASAKAWRGWLKQNHDKSTGIWLIMYNKDSGLPSVHYPEAVDEALCFGWVDSAPRRRNEQSYFQYFSPRKPKSNWSKVNKDKVARLTEAGKMTSAGKKMVALAQANGQWNALDAVERLEQPEDLRALFRANPLAYQHWKGFSRSSRRVILEWIQNAKQPATRKKRLEETVRLAEQKIKANHPVKPS